MDDARQAGKTPRADDSRKRQSKATGHKSTALVYCLMTTFVAALAWSFHERQHNLHAASAAENQVNQSENEPAASGPALRAPETAKTVSTEPDSSWLEEVIRSQPPMQSNYAPPVIDQRRPSIGQSEWVSLEDLPLNDGSDSYLGENTYSGNYDQRVTHVEVFQHQRPVASAPQRVQYNVPLNHARSPVQVAPISSMPQSPGIEHQFGHSVRFSAPTPVALQESDDDAADEGEDENDQEEDREGASELLGKFDNRQSLTQLWKSGSERDWISRIHPSIKKPEDASFSEWSDGSPQYALVSREWPEQTKHWKPPRLVHPPVYLEDDELERFGNSYGLLQPAVSATRFYGGIGMLPFEAMHKHPDACQRDRQYPRVGSPAAMMPGHCGLPTAQPLSLGPVRPRGMTDYASEAPCPECQQRMHSSPPPNFHSH